MEQNDRNMLQSAIKGVKPLKSFIKTELGRVYVTIWDSMLNKEVGVILYGNPREFDDNCIVDIWSEQELVFLKRMNKRHFETGTLIEYKRPDDEVKTPPVEASSDEQLIEIINAPFLKLQHVLNATDSIPFLFRIKYTAPELEKSEKIIKAIEARISEVQAKEYASIPSALETEI